MSQAAEKAHIHRDRRRFQRVHVDIPLRFMLQNSQEFDGKTIDMSPGGVAIVSQFQPKLGEEVIVYLEEIGRIEGKVTRLIDDEGFAVSFKTTDAKRDKFASTLTWLANREVLGLPEDRRHERFDSKVAESLIQLNDGSLIRCKIVNISQSGAHVTLGAKPEVGEVVHLGQIHCTVVRHIGKGIGLEFHRLMHRENIDQYLVPNL